MSLEQEKATVLMLEMLPPHLYDLAWSWPGWVPCREASMPLPTDRVTVTLDDGTEVDVYGVSVPTRTTLYDPGDPWNWKRTEPAYVDEDALIEALEEWRWLMGPHP